MTYTQTIYDYLIQCSKDKKIPNIGDINEETSIPRGNIVVVLNYFVRKGIIKEGDYEKMKENKKEIKREQITFN